MVSTRAASQLPATQTSTAQPHSVREANEHPKSWERADLEYGEASQIKQVEDMLRDSERRMAEM
jgi:hypothetical protein